MANVVEILITAKNMALGPIKDAQGALANLGASAQKAADSSKAAQKNMQALSTAGMQLGVVGGIMTAALVGFGAASLKAAGEVERIRISFEALLKNKDLTAGLLKDIREFSAATPMMFKGLADNAKTLVGAGVGVADIVGTLKDLGNAAMGSAEKLNSLTLAYSKMKTKGKADLEQLNIFLEAGIPILGELQKQLGVKTPEAVFKMLEKGQVSFAVFNKAIHALTNGTGVLAGQLEAAAGTLEGKISNMAEGFETLKVTLGNALLPVAKLVVDKLTSLFNIINGLPGPAKVMVAVFGGVTIAIVGITMSLMGLAAGFVALNVATGGASWAIMGAVGLIGVAVATVVTTIVVFKNKIYEIFQGIRLLFLDFRITMAEWQKTIEDTVLKALNKIIDKYNKLASVIKFLPKIDNMGDGNDKIEATIAALKVQREEIVKLIQVSREKAAAEEKAAKASELAAQKAMEQAQLLAAQAAGPGGAAGKTPEQLKLEAKLALLDLEIAIGNKQQENAIKIANLDARAYQDLVDEIALKDAYYATLTKGTEEEKKLYAELIALRTKLIDADKKKNDAFTKGITDLAVMQSSKIKEVAAIGKAAAIYDIGIKTHQAAMNAMANVPFPFNWLAAGAAIVYGGEQMAAVSSATPAFQEGGIVPGSRLATDQTVIRTTPGEAILNQEQQQNLLNLANGNGGASQGNTSVTINVDSVKLADAMVKGYNKGVNLGLVAKLNTK